MSILDDLKAKDNYLDYRTSVKVDKILPALLAAKKDMSKWSSNFSGSVLKKDKKVGENRFSYSHTTLPLLNAIVTPFLSRQKLLCVNMPYVDKDEDCYATRIYHVDSCQWIEAAKKVYLQKATSQEYGSVSTYSQRYFKMALLDLASADDDGQQGSRAEEFISMEKSIYEHLNSLENGDTDGEDGKSDSGETEKNVAPETKETKKDEIKHEQ